MTNASERTRSGEPALRARVAELERRLVELDEQLRRARAGTISFGGLVLDRFARSAVLDGDALRLLPREWAVLAALVEARGDVVAVGRLRDAVWGEAPLRPSNGLAVHVSRLRRRLEGSSVAIVTRRGQGYGLAELPDRPARRRS